MQEKSENITCIKKKLLYFIDTQSIKKEDFYKKVGIDGANFRGKNLKSELSADKIVNILRQFPEISPDWLLMDSGEMLRTQRDEQPRCAASEGSATEIELLRSAIRDKEERIEELKERIEDMKEIQLLLRDRISFLEAEVAHYESASGVAAAAG